MNQNPKVMIWKSQIQWWAGTHPLRPNVFLTSFFSPRASKHFSQTNTKHYPTSQTLSPRWLFRTPLLERCFPRHFLKHQASTSIPRRESRAKTADYRGSLGQWAHGPYLSETIELNKCFSPAHKIVKTMWGAAVTLDFSLNSWKSFASSM